MRRPSMLYHGPTQPPAPSENKLKLLRAIPAQWKRRDRSNAIRPNETRTNSCSLASHLSAQHRSQHCSSRAWRTGAPESPLLAGPGLQLASKLSRALRGQGFGHVMEIIRFLSSVPRTPLLCNQRVCKRTNKTPEAAWKPHYRPRIHWKPLLNKQRILL